MSKVTVREAALLTGKSRETINVATNAGKISFSRDGQNRKVIDVSELERVYPIVGKLGETQKPNAVRLRQRTELDCQLNLELEIVVLKERLDSLAREKEQLVEERHRERRQLESEIESLRATLEKSQEQSSKSMLFLTDATRVDVGNKSFKEELTSKWNVFEKALQGLQEQQAQVISAVHSKAKKPFWSKIF